MFKEEKETMSFADRVDKVMTVVEKSVVAICLALMMCIVFYGVVNRFIVKRSLQWSEELSRYLTIWATYVGASLGVRWGSHIGVEAFVNLLPKKARSCVNLVTYLACLAFVAFVTVTGFQFTEKLLTTQQLSPAMRIPMAWAYAGVPVGALFMGVRYLMLVVQDVGVIFKGKEESTDGECPTLNV
jgi:C4-dicarboxylate transporter DctQ subunit